MAAVLIDNPAGLSPGAIEELASIVGGHRTLQDAVRWAFSQDPPLVVAEVIVQDEFTHDVVFPFRGSLHLVYDTT